MENAVETSTPQYFHGTRAALRPGDLLTAGQRSNYRAELVMNHVYFTAKRDGGGLAAEIAVLLGPEGSEPHVYLVEPTGPLEDDPNATDKRRAVQVLREGMHSEWHWRQTDGCSDSVTNRFGATRWRSMSVYAIDVSGG